MQKKKKIATAITSTVLVGALLIGGTIAYLSDSETTTNVFTVGNATIEATEPNYPGNGSDEVTNITSLTEIPKDPQIENTGDVDVIVYERVNIPMAEVVTAAEDGTLLNDGEAILTELFEFRTEDGEYSSYNDSWILLNVTYFYIDSDGNEVVLYTAEDTVDSIKDLIGSNDYSAAVSSKQVYASYLWGYTEVIGVGETTDSVFDYVRLVNIVEGTIDGSVINDTSLEMPVTSYAIQADNISGITDTDFTLDEETLESIYEVFVNQNTDGTVDLDSSESLDADLSGNLTSTSSTLKITATSELSTLIFNSGDDDDLDAVVDVVLSYTGNGDIPESVTVTTSDSNVVSIPSSTVALEGTETKTDEDASEYLEDVQETVQAEGSFTITAEGTGTAVITVSATNEDDGTTVAATITINVVDWND